MNKKEKKIIYGKKYREEHKKEITEYRKKYREEHKKELQEHLKEYRQKPEVILRERQYKEENREKILLIKKQRGREFRQWFYDYKKTLCCLYCGYNNNYKKLHFHHPDDNKEFKVSSGNLNNKKKIIKEIKKCITLCNWCHSKLHHPKKIKEI